MKKFTFIFAFLSLLGMTATTAVLAEGGSDDGDNVQVKTTLSVKADTADDKDSADTEDSNDDANEHTGGSQKAAVTTNLLDKVKLRATEELDRRLGKLENLSTRAEDLRRIDDNTKASITAAIDAQIKALTDLKAKITAETDSKTVKEDVKTIVDTHKSFALVLPKAAIVATADKLNAAVDLMNSFAAKLQTRIDAVTTAGGDTTALKAALTDFNSKLTDAKAQTKAAVDLTATMKAEDGTQATFNANIQILQQARLDLKKAREDLRIARQDAEKIVNGVKGKHTGEDQNKPDVKASTDTETEVNND